ncbi:hypothetical protein SAMD00079811_73280 [Scytonema sp. HK-05]|nr:hypothetical protein SAMD00079811_73280 [Scytonema sp. HK-05]
MSYNLKINIWVNVWRNPTYKHFVIAISATYKVVLNYKNAFS